MAFAALIEACAAPDIQRIIFLDAPRVTGPEAWRAIELKYAYGGMTAMLAPVLLSILAKTARAVSLQPDLSDDAHHLMNRMLNALRRDGSDREGGAQI